MTPLALVPGIGDQPHHGGNNETTDFYERLKGKKAVVLFLKDVVKTTDLT